MSAPPPSISSADVVTLPEENRYDARDTKPERSGQYPGLQRALMAYIKHLTVEFLKLKGNEVKPHVVFRLVFAHPVPDPAQGRTFLSARVSMEAVGDDSSQASGACEIKLCSYLDRTTSATAGFQFELRKTAMTLGDFVSVVMGTHQELQTEEMPGSARSDLTHFDFEGMPQANGDEYWDGCRD